MSEISLPEPLESLLKIETKALTNFFGGPGSGKTNICLLAALECAKKGGSVAYIDTEGGFSFERLSQLAPNYKLFLKNIKIFEPKNFEEQGLALKQLQGMDVNLVIVDSLSALYRLEFSDQKKNKEVNAQILEANRELSKQMSILSNLSREKGIPVLLTSHTFKSWDTGVSDVVGGDSVKYWSKALVLLEKTGRTSERKATIIKHRSMPEGKQAKFVIVHEGIKPSGFRLF
jgi:DNA repair protein RadB